MRDDRKQTRSSHTLRLSLVLRPRHAPGLCGLTLADEPSQGLGHAADQIVNVDHLRAERLPAAERQQLSGQRGGPLGRLEAGSGSPARQS